MAASIDRPPVTEAPGNAGQLARRMRTSALYVPVLLVAAWPGGWVFAAFVSVVSVVALLELHGMTVRLARPSYRAITVPVGIAIPLLMHAEGLARESVWPILALVVVALAFRRRAGVFGALAMSVLAVAYVPLLLGHLVLIRDGRFTGGELGLELVLFLFLVTWSCDTFAYLVGRRFGRLPLWPAISPRKTVEGALGGVVGAMATAAAARVFVSPVISLYDAIGVGLVLSVALQLGDLFESKLKRKSEVKDSSSILPGHGGVLDRFDSMLFGAPALAFLLIVLVGRGG